MTGEPYPKSRQLARGSRRYWRKIAGPKTWQAIIDSKQGPCRVCDDPKGPVEYHHLVPRDFGGDDIPENVVPLHRECHRLVTNRDRDCCLAMFSNLTDAEYAYAVDRAGEDVWQRVYGLGAAYTDPTASRKAPDGF